MARLYDRSTKITRVKTKDGYLVADGILSRTGIQEYTPAELTHGGVTPPTRLMNKPLIKLNRSPEEVFKNLNGLEHLPMTLGHPEDDVTVDNIKDLSVGITLTPVKRDGDFAGGPIMVQTKDGLNAVESGMDQLSVGYRSEVVFLDEKQSLVKGYDGEITNIIPNHVALVDRARGGENVRIKDAKGDIPMESRLIDGISIEFTTQAAQAVDKLVGRIGDAEKTKTQEAAKLNDQISVLTAQLDATKKELETEKQSRLSDEQVTKLVNEKTALVEKAKHVIGDGTDWTAKTNTEIKQEIVKKIYDGFNFEGKDALYIDTVYDVAVATAGKSAPSASQKLGDGILQNSGNISDGQKAEQKFNGYRKAKYNGGK